MKRIAFTLIGAATLLAADAPAKPRVFVGASDSWEMTGRAGGARPQTAEVLKTFGQRCGSIVTITNNRDKADYVVTIDHEGGKGYARMDTKVAVFNRDGDMILGNSTRSIGGAVKDACEAIAKANP